MTDRIKVRRDLAAQWTAVNPILADGEIAYEKDVRKIKIGDGATEYNLLPYFEPGGALPAGVQGNILYHDGTGWVVLAPGDPGYVLTAGGPGANPAWAAGGGETTLMEVDAIGNDSRVFENMKTGQTVLIPANGRGKFSGHSNSIATALSRIMRPSPRHWSTLPRTSDETSVSGTRKASNVVRWDRPGIDGDLMWVESQQEPASPLSAVLHIFDRELTSEKKAFNLGDFSAYYLFPSTEIEVQMLVVDGDYLYITLFCSAALPANNQVVVLRFTLDVDSAGDYTLTHTPLATQHRVIDPAVAYRPQVVDTQIITNSEGKHLRTLVISVGPLYTVKKTDLWKWSLIDGSDLSAPITYPDRLYHQPTYQEIGGTRYICSMRILLGGLLLVGLGSKINETTGAVIYDLQYMAVPASIDGQIGGYIGFLANTVIGSHHLFLGMDRETNTVPAIQRFDATTGAFVDEVYPDDPTPDGTLGFQYNRFVHDPVNGRLYVGGAAYMPGAYNDLSNLSKTHLCLATWTIDTVNFVSLKSNVLHRPGDFIFSDLKTTFLSSMGLTYDHRAIGIATLEGSKRYGVEGSDRTGIVCAYTKNLLDYEVDWSFAALATAGLYKSRHTGDMARVTLPSTVVLYKADGAVDSVDEVLADSGLQTLSSQRVLIPPIGPVASRVVGPLGEALRLTPASEGALRDFAFHETELATIVGAAPRKNNSRDFKERFSSSYGPTTTFQAWGEFSYGVTRHDNLMLCARMDTGETNSYKLVWINPNNNMIVGTPTDIWTLLGGDANIKYPQIFKMYNHPTNPIIAIAFGKYESAVDGRYKLFVCHIDKETLAMVGGSLLATDIGTDPSGSKFEIMSSLINASTLFVLCTGSGSDSGGGYANMYIHAAYNIALGTVSVTEHPFTMLTHAMSSHLVRLVEEDADLIVYYRSEENDDEVVKFNLTANTLEWQAPFCDSKNSKLVGLDIADGLLYVGYNAGGASPTFKMKIWDLTDFSTPLAEQIFEFGGLDWYVKPGVWLRVFSDSLVYVMHHRAPSALPAMLSVFKWQDGIIREIDRRPLLDTGENTFQDYRESFFFDELVNARFGFIGSFHYDDGVLIEDYLAIAVERKTMMPVYTFEESADGRLYFDRRNALMYLKSKGSLREWSLNRPKTEYVGHIAVSNDDPYTTLSVEVVLGTVQCPQGEVLRFSGVRYAGILDGNWGNARITLQVLKPDGVVQDLSEYRDFSGAVLLREEMLTLIKSELAKGDIIRALVEVQPLATFIATFAATTFDKVAPNELP